MSKTDERRARVISEALSDWDETGILSRHVACARAIRASDEAAGMVLVPRDDMDNIVALLRHAMMFRPYVEYTPGPLSEPWATKVLRDAEAMIAAAEKNNDP
jgi:hypothetical protein